MSPVNLKHGGLLVSNVIIFLVYGLEMLLVKVCYVNKVINFLLVCQNCVLQFGDLDGIVGCERESCCGNAKCDQVGLLFCSGHCCVLWECITKVIEFVDLVSEAVMADCDNVCMYVLNGSCQILLYFCDVQNLRGSLEPVHEIEWDPDIDVVG